LFRTSRLLVAVSFVSALFAGCAGSSGSGSNAACRSVCEDTCSALGKCGIADIPKTCADDCTAGLGSSNCANARPANQLTCAELKDVYDVAEYCATACQRATECGTFDAKLCVTGCALIRPQIHNPKSVAARTCDQLKPEVRSYEDRGRAQQSGSGTTEGFAGTTNPYGLCETANDCADALGCDLETNTCAPCKTNADCDLGYGKQACTPDQKCQSAQCLEDADCPSFSKKCDPGKYQCVECLADADCVGAVLGSKCEVTAGKCVQCVTSADCVGSLPNCSATSHFCMP
jgi:hypothetical protein